MNTWTLLGIACALAMDAFAVSASVASTLPRWTFRHVFRLAWHFGLFQALMTMAGGLGGAVVAGMMAEVDHWIAFSVLLFLGARMLWESFHFRERHRSYDPTRGWSLVGLSVATSIDALMVGVYIGLIGLAIWTPAGVIGLVALVLSAVGCYTGRTAANYLGRWAERLGAVILVVIGTRILVQHLSGAG